MGKGSPWEGGLGGKAADLKAWRRWSDDKGDFPVTESELSSLGPQGRPAPRPLKCEREDREMGRGQMGPISPRGTTHSLGTAGVGEAAGTRASEAEGSLAGDSHDAPPLRPALTCRDTGRAWGRPVLLAVQQGKLRPREVE